MNELNLIIETIAPSKRIQCIKKHNKWYDKNIEKLAIIRDKAHNNAKSNNTEENWRVFRLARNNYNKGVKSAKRMYFSDKLTVKNKKENCNTKCKNVKDEIAIKKEYNVENKLGSTVKDITNTKKKIAPRNIIHNNRVVTSLKDVANISNQHYIAQIDTIRNKFTKSDLSHLDILKKLIPKPKTKMKIPFITIDKTKEIIKKMKSSNSLGHDCASIKIYKKII